MVSLRDRCRMRVRENEKEWKSDWFWAQGTKAYPYYESSNNDNATRRRKYIWNKHLGFECRTDLYRCDGVRRWNISIFSKLQSLIIVWFIDIYCRAVRFTLYQPAGKHKKTPWKIKQNRNGTSFFVARLPIKKKNATALVFHILLFWAEAI